jgi:2-(1,2-epoxy-1,2-dihydrophenyl)acetyl-CoA isomerase
MEPPVLERSADGVGRLTLNRPSHRNAMSPEMLELLYQKLKQMDDDPQIRCIVLDGAGGHFVAGGDVKSWAALRAMTPKERGENFTARMAPSRPAIEFIGALTKPLIVALRGYSAGAGIGLVLAADFVIADETAKFLFANIRMGLIPDLGITYYLPRVVGERQARRLCLLGEQLDAPQAQAAGIVDEVTTPELLEDAVDKLTAKLAGAPAKALVETKRLMRISRQNGLSAQLSEENKALATCAQEQDFIEAITSFAERRPPRFGTAA